MTFLAPKQGLFAAIIVVSLCLHMLFFVISEEREIEERQRIVAEQSVAELIQELKVPLANNDRISMSVIADRYIKERQLAFIGVYDAKDTLLVPVGMESDDGVLVKDAVVSGTQALGSVVVKTADISRAQMISQHWLFLFGALGLHAMLWLIYGHLARPTEELKQAIAKKVRLDLLNKGIIQHTPNLTTQSALESDDESQGIEIQEKSPASVQSFLDKTKHQSKADALTDEDGYVVQVMFEDPNQLLAAVSPDTKVAYFALCDQLLDKAVHHLLELPLLNGVNAEIIKYYDDAGAKIVLNGDAHAKSATAAILLSKLMLMLNQVVYEKHREIKRFAWQIRTAVSDVQNAEATLSLAKRRRETPLVFIDEKAQNESKIYVELMRLENPKSIHERECRGLASLTRATAERLRAVRDKVLLEP